MTEQIIVSTALLISVAIIAFVGLKGWQGWLSLKERELERGIASVRAPTEADQGSAMGAARIELSDLKERIRKLEAIASGVDL
ncbi:MAG: hypothetical protein ACR2PC_03455 [Tsuneonella suprasediminis]|uniref:Uncharacterized protein n=1 Tax=Tsuneonella suprasediminis TaxID=2306996 RepID=A0A419R5Y0_9SPHN|nr:hypothetical protein [Tsuneonella suprasediminis]RJX71296.1 hypothetical protein D6858_01400 [Tsuneonella suprasediminis]UBS34561.1 hypothetical protein LBX01_08230 [Altererythrobacter sp. N1]